MTTVSTGIATRISCGGVSQFAGNNFVVTTEMEVAIFERFPRL